LRRIYNIGNIPWYYALFIGAIIMFWAHGINQAQRVSENALKARNDGEFKKRLSSSDDNVGRLTFYTGILACIVSGGKLITLKRLKCLSGHFIVFILLVLASAWSTYAASKQFDIGFTDLRSDFGISTVFAYGLILIGYDPRAWHYAIKTISLLAFLTVLVVLPQIPNCLTLPYDIYRMYFVYFIAVLIWIAPAPLLAEEHTQAAKPLFVRSIPLFCLILICWASVSRSWIIQSAVCSLVVSWKCRKILSKHWPLFLSGIGISIVLFGVLFSDILLLSYDRLMDRITTDTRSGQYTIFFSQTSLRNFIQGCGLKATYVYHGTASYTHFDNQFMTMIFKMGIIFALGYFYLMIYPALRLLMTNVENKTYPVMVVLLHLLACLGLSVFYNLALFFPIIVVALCAGRCWYLLNHRAFL